MPHAPAEPLSVWADRDLARSLVVIFSGIALIWERALGIIHKLFVSPTPRAALVIGKALSAGVRSLSQWLRAHEPWMEAAGVRLSTLAT